MLRVLTALGFWLLVVPANAAEVQCGTEGEGLVEGADGPVWVSVDDRVHVIDPAAAPGEAQSVESFCGDHQNLIAIVIPAPKPGPDDDPTVRSAPNTDEFQVTQGEMGDAQRGAVLFRDAGYSPLEEVGADSDSAPATDEAEAALPIAEQASGLSHDPLLASGCDTTPNSGGSAWWAFALMAALALRRRHP